MGAFASAGTVYPFFWGPRFGTRARSSGCTAERPLRCRCWLLEGGGELQIESPGFTEDDLRVFFNEVIAYERTRPRDGLTLVERLEAASRRLAQVVGSIGPGGGRQPPVGGGWTARETLAHIVLVSQVLGWGTWAIASGER